MLEFALLLSYLETWLDRSKTCWIGARCCCYVTQLGSMTSYAYSLVLVLRGDMDPPGIGFMDYEHLGYRTIRQGCQGLWDGCCLL